MKFLSHIRLRRRRNQNPSSSYVEMNTEMDTHESVRKRKLETEEESSSSDTKKESIETNGDSGNLKATTSLSFGERKSTIDIPPTDDCCPICFGSFVAPCRAPCGHWYCGGCILEYWNHVATFWPCKCPMCSREIMRLTPEASLYHQEDAKISEVLKNVQQYNRLFIGGAYGLLLKVLQFPLFLKRVLQAMMDPDRPGAYLSRLRLFAAFLGALYTLSPFHFLPTWQHLDAIDLFDCSAIVLSISLYLVGLFLRRRRLQQVRQLAAIQH